MQLCGQFVIEASTAPEHLDEFFAQVMRLLAAQAETIAPVDLERAQNQIAVRTLRAQEHPAQRLEDAVLDLFALGRVRARAEVMERVHAVTATQVRSEFERMLGMRAAIAMAGQVPKGAGDRVRELGGASRAK
jgi:predicted Zn-dependent peptidase